MVQEVGRKPTALDVAASGSREVLDVVVVGAGWAGMYMLHRLQETGYNARVFEAGSGVGGAWYWNRYPGARVDTRSLVYSYSFSPELQQEWEWSELYCSQAELEAYANHVADRFDLRKNIKFDTRVTAAKYDASSHRWNVDTDQGDRVAARFLIMATGGYTVPTTPDIPGIDKFGGEVYYTSRWPKDPVSFIGKRIGVIGTGSSGAQVSLAVSNKPIEHLYVFQRTANFILQSWNRPADPEYTAAFKKQYDAFREEARVSRNGSPFPDPTGYRLPVGPVADLSDEEFEKRMWEFWEQGTHGLLGSISDLFTSEKVNNRVADFLRDRIRERVHDPETAELLCPKGYYFGERRIVMENDYYGIFNKPKVTLVDIKSDPIEEITRDSVKTANAKYPIDMLVLATGFDSGTGAMLEVDIVGKNGVKMTDKWAEGPRTYLGLMIESFPNLFMIAQAGSPGIRSQVLNSIEQHVDWIKGFLDYTTNSEILEVEPTLNSEQLWTEHVADVASRSIQTTHPTQYWGANVPGKPRVYLSYLGGVRRYKGYCDAVRDKGYEGFVLATKDGVVPGTKDWAGPGESTSTYIGGL